MRTWWIFEDDNGTMHLFIEREKVRKREPYGITAT